MSKTTSAVTRRVQTVPAAWGVNSEIAVTVFPLKGIIQLREIGRRESSAVAFDIADLYVKGIVARVQAQKRAKAKARKEGRR